MAFSFDIAVILQRQRRRVKRRSTGIRREIFKSHEPSPEIPFDIVIEILTRLPAKSLMRFKSVSKLWSSLICSRNFTDRLQRVSSSSLHLYMTVSFYDNNNQLRGRLLSSTSPPGSDITTMSSFVTVHDLTTPAMKGYRVSHVFGGLMCLVKDPSAQIYNTSTRQLFVLPDIKESSIIAKDHKNRKIMYHIGHDLVHDQYKVVCIVARPSEKELGTYESEHLVLLLGGEGSSRWRKIPSPCPPHLPVSRAFNSNGRMHYLAWVRVPDYMLVSFDFNSEETSMLPAPDIPFFRVDPIEYCGKVAILHYSHIREGMMKLWVMEDADKNVGWSEKTLVLHPSQIHLVNNVGLRIQGTTRNGEVIFVPHNFITLTRTGKAMVVDPQNTTLLHIFLYDLQNNLMRKVEINESQYHTKKWDVVGLDDVENLMNF